MGGDDRVDEGESEAGATPAVRAGTTGAELLELLEPVEPELVEPELVERRR